MQINLRDIREETQPLDRTTGKAKPISVKDLSAMLGEKVNKKIHPTQIVRFEDDPGSVPFDLLIPWLQCLGTTIEEQLLAVRREPEQTVDGGDPYAKLTSRISLLQDYLDSAKDSFVAIEAEDSNGLPTFADITRITKSLGRKPNIVLSGAFDAGKSTLANWLLSSHSLPERYQPMTAVVTYVKHIDDKPDWIKDDVVLLNGTFDPDLWNDKKHISASKVLEGKLEILKEYGTHNQKRNAESAENALVFLKSPILKSCNIIDYPGFQNNEDDTQRAEKAYRNIDVLIFASAAGGFMNGPDLVILREFFRRLPIYENASSDFPTLGNLFIVATHAGPQLSDDQLFGSDSGPGLLDIATDRLWRELHEHEIAPRSLETGREITRDLIRSRLFTFWRENSERTKPLSQSIISILSESLPICFQIEADKKVFEFKNNANLRLSSIIDSYQETLNDLDYARELYKNKLADESARVAVLTQLHGELIKLVSEYKVAHLADFSRIYTKNMVVETLEKTIKARYDDKKEAQQHMPAYVITSIRSESEEFAKEKSTRVAQLIEGYIATYDNSLSIDMGDKGTIDIPFDSRGSFIGGLAGLGSVGALAMWASSLGNLGGYIIAAKAVGILSALGISITGGAAAAMSGIAALGGPVTLAFALAAAVFFMFRAFFGESWQSRLAKQIVDHAKKEKIEEKLRTAISDFWDNTLVAFERGTQKIEDDYKNELFKFGQIVEEPKKAKEAQEMVERYLKARDFFAGMPWFLLGTRQS